MNITKFLIFINHYSALPATIIFLTVGIILTLKTRFLQIRGIPTLLHILKRERLEQEDTSKKGSLSSLKALFTAMATTIGMGNVVGPSVAIMMGGPGALFWILAFQFFGGLIKFVEVSFAISTRVRMSTGRLVGGPSEYLAILAKPLGKWYGFLTIFLFTAWSSLQSNTLGQILALEGVSPWLTGIFISTVLAVIIWGGVKRIGNVASILVPIMFVAYVSFALIILFQNMQHIMPILKSVLMGVFSPQAAISGITSGSILYTMRCGVYRSIFITEAGLGTSSIPHALAEVKRPTDQGILAMYSVVFDAFLSLLSGLIVLITDVWYCGEQLDSTVIYQAFKLQAPFLGQYILLCGIALFVITTIIGNTLNGTQSFAAITNGKFIWLYQLMAVIGVFWGAMSNVPLLWELSDILLTCVAIPNIIGILILALRRAEVISLT